MTKQSIGSTTATCLLVVVVCVSGHADTILLDGFSDGSLTNDFPVNRNGMPVKWVAENATQISANTGDLVVQSATNSVPGAFVENLLVPGDLSVRFQGRLTTEGLIGIAAHGHYALLDDDGTASIGRLGSSTPLQFIPTPFRPLMGDVLMQFDAVGATYDLWVWRPGESIPPQPVIRLTDNSLGSNRVGVGGVSSGFPNASNFEAVFRFVHVADSPIPEPSSGALIIMGAMAVVLFIANCRIR